MTLILIPIFQKVELFSTLNLTQSNRCFKTLFNFWIFINFRKLDSKNVFFWNYWPPVTLTCLWGVVIYFIYKYFSSWKLSFEKKMFLLSRNFFMNFDLNNSCKNEFKDNKEKSCSWSRNRVSHKIDFRAVWPRNGHAASLGVKYTHT